MTLDQQAHKFPVTSPVSFLMPVCNEEDVIREVIEEWMTDVIQYLPQASELVFDDCSTDRTTEIIEELSRKYPMIRVIRSQRDGFFASAMRLYKSATCPLVFFTDSDGQYVPGEFWKIAPFIATHDMVHGAKSHRKDPGYRLVASRGFNLFTRWFFSSKGADVNSAFRLIDRRMLDQVLPTICHMPTLLNAEMFIRAEAEGFKIKCIEVDHRERKYGKSRGLPPKRFLMEIFAAFVGLIELRNEVRKALPARVQARELEAGS